MSGGSYDYLYSATDLIELVQHTGHLEDMAARLVELDMGEAARRTEDLLATLRVVERVAMAAAGELSEVWRAVERLDSGDGGNEEVVRAGVKLALNS